VSYSCTDFTDSILDALDIYVPPKWSEGPEYQADLALAEIKRLQNIEKLLRDNLDRIIGALSTVQDIDDENGHADEAKAGRDLIGELQNLPDPAQDEPAEDEDEGD
jgi:hypothetical protein